MEDSIFKKIGSRIRRLFGRDQDAEIQEVPEVPDTPAAPEEPAAPAVQAAVEDETSCTCPEGGESISLDAPPEEPLESRWTEEYVQFLKETDGGLPQGIEKEEKELAPEEEKAPDAEPEEAPEWCDLPKEPAEETPEWCDLPEDAAEQDESWADQPEEGLDAAETGLDQSPDPEERKE